MQGYAGVAARRSLPHELRPPLEGGDDGDVHHVSGFPGVRPGKGSGHLSSTDLHLAGLSATDLPGLTCARPTYRKPGYATPACTPPICAMPTCAAPTSKAPTWMPPTFGVPSWMALTFGLRRSRR